MAKCYDGVTMSGWFRDTPESRALLAGERTKLDVIETIHEVDQMLFDAGVAALHTKTEKDRKYVDRLITDARVKLEALRARLT